MSISTGPVSVGDGLQHSQKTASPAAGSSAPGAVFNARATSVPAAISKMPAAKAAADAKDGEVKLSAKQVQQSLEEINKVLTGFSISVQFEIDPNYKDVIIKVVDQDNGKVIRQIPTEDVVRLSKAMDNLKGLLFAQSA